MRHTFGRTQNPGTPMQTLPIHYHLGLVALSVLVAILAAYVALDLVGRVSATAGRARQAWLAAGALAMGIGIWSMHFIGMEAFHTSIRVEYEIRLAVLSFLAAVGASAVAFRVVSGPRMTA